LKIFLKIDLQTIYSYCKLIYSIKFLQIFYRTKVFAFLSIIIVNKNKMGLTKKCPLLFIKLFLIIVFESNMLTTGTRATWLACPRRLVIGPSRSLCRRLSQSGLRVSPIILRDNTDGGWYSGDSPLFVFNSFFGFEHSVHF
jgi:hypothetical protein